MKTTAAAFDDADVALAAGDAGVRDKTASALGPDNPQRASRRLPAIAARGRPAACAHLIDRVENLAVWVHTFPVQTDAVAAMRLAFFLVQLAFSLC